MTRLLALVSGRRRAVLAGVILVACVTAPVPLPAAPAAGALPATTSRPRAVVTPAVANARVFRMAAALARHEREAMLDDPGPAAWRAHHESDLVSATQAVIESDRLLRGDLSRQLETLARDVPRTALSPARRADLAVVQSRLVRERIERDQLRCDRADPGRVLPRVDGSIRALLAGRSDLRCRRLVPVTRRLRGVPEALRAAQVGLERPSRLAVETAVAALHRTLTLYRTTLPEAVLGCRDAVEVAPLAEADTLAANALESFVDWLERDVMPRADGSWAMGRETYARWLQAAMADTLEIVTVRARAEHELAAAAAPTADAWRDDSLRWAVADSLLAVGEIRAPRGTASWPRLALGRREYAVAWASYAIASRLVAPSPGASGESRIAPSRLDLVAMLVEIDLHAGDASIEDARRRLMSDAGLDSAAADIEARRAALSPGRSLATITAWQLEVVRLEALDRLGKRFSPRTHLAAMMEEGAVPPAAIRERLLGRLPLPPRVSPSP